MVEIGALISAFSRVLKPKPGEIDCTRCQSGDISITVSTSKTSVRLSVPFVKELEQSCAQYHTPSVILHAERKGPQFKFLLRTGRDAVDKVT